MRSRIWRVCRCSCVRPRAIDAVDQGRAASHSRPDVCRVWTAQTVPMRRSEPLLGRVIGARRSTWLSFTSDEPGQFVAAGGHARSARRLRSPAQGASHSQSDNRDPLCAWKTPDRAMQCLLRAATTRAVASLSGEQPAYDDREVACEWLYGHAGDDSRLIARARRFRVVG